MSEKKVVRRSVAIALGIICILLVVVSLVGAFAYYTPIINDKDNTISSLNSKVSDLTDIVNLGKSTVWVNDTTVTQTASNYTSWFFLAYYAGYVSVSVQSSTTNNTYVRVIYSASTNGINYDKTITVGTSGVAAFPVLTAPLSTLVTTSNEVEIRVGNTNTVGNATETVTITYYY